MINREFNKLVQERLDVIFQKHNLQVYSPYYYCVECRSAKVAINIVHDLRDHSYVIFIGRNKEELNLVEIDNDVMANFFNSELRLSLLPIDVFLDNLVVFFESYGKPLLEGDSSRLIELEEFNLKRSEEYTNKILLDQKMNKIDKAWYEKRFKDFVEYIDSMDKKKLSETYLMKYRIARKKI